MTRPIGSTGLVCGWLLLGLAACANTHASDAAQARPVAKPNHQAAGEGVQSKHALKEAERLDNLPAIVPQKGHLDHSGRKQKGRASYYSHHFAHKKMADGHRMNPHSNVAASKSLPLGTTAMVTNLENGKSVMVKVEDRGPFVDGRVVDVSPHVAGQLGIEKKGVVPVVVKPIAVPQPDGDVKLGAGAADLEPHEIREATATTRALTEGP